MIEPNWGELPFRTDGSTWKAFVRESGPESEPAVGEGEGEVAGEGETRPPLVCGTVWVERDACFDFTNRTQLEVMTAFEVLGDGVLRWAAAEAAKGTTLGGKIFQAEFGGAPGVKYQITCPGESSARGLRGDLRGEGAGVVGGGSGGVFLLHLPIDYYQAREEAEMAAENARRAGAVEKRLIRRVPPERSVSTRNIRGPGPGDGKLLKKWMP